MRLSLRVAAVGASVSMITALTQVTVAGQQSQEPRFFITVHSQRYDYIRGGGGASYVAPYATLDLSGDRSSVSMSVTARGGDDFTLTFAAPRGRSLRPGPFVGAQRAPTRTGRHPGIDFAPTPFCSDVTGRFDIKQIRFRDDSLTDLWLTYEMHCDDRDAALFGEVRIGVLAGGAVTRKPMGSLRFPNAELGEDATRVSVVFVPRMAGASINSVAIRGRNPEDFTLAVDGCTGRELTAEQGCASVVEFAPQQVGPRTARLVLSLTSGRRHVTQLDGFGVDTRTTLQMTSDPGDFVGQGREWNYDLAAGDRFGVEGDRHALQGRLDARGGPFWQLEFQAPDGEPLAEGRTYSAMRYPVSSPGAAMAVFGDGRGCNQLQGSFTVHELVLSPTDNPRRTDISFEQHCEGSVPALRGVFEYRVPRGDRMLPPQVSNAKHSRHHDMVTLSWQNPSNANVRETIVRYLRGAYAPRRPSSGLMAETTSTTSARFGIPDRFGATAAIYTVDDDGNVSRPTVLRIDPERR